MTDLPTKLSNLRALLDAATPGPWVSHYDEDGFYNVELKRELKVCRTYGNSLADHDDATFIAATDPEVIRALVDVAEQAAQLDPDVNIGDELHKIRAALNTLNKALSENQHEATQGTER